MVATDCVLSAGLPFKLMRYRLFKRTSLLRLLHSHSTPVRRISPIALLIAPCLQNASKVAGRDRSWRLIVEAFWCNGVHVAECWLDHLLVCACRWAIFIAPTTRHSLSQMLCGRQRTLLSNKVQEGGIGSLLVSEQNKVNQLHWWQKSRENQEKQSSNLSVGNCCTTNLKSPPTLHHSLEHPHRGATAQHRW